MLVLRSQITVPRSRMTKTTVLIADPVWPCFDPKLTVEAL